MKKVILSVALAALIFAANTSVSANTLTGRTTISVADWAKSKDGTWAGNNKTWYKIDKDAKLWKSMDGKKWEADASGMWQDKDGKWLKIDNKSLKWSADGGKTWSEVPEWKWQGSDGMWNKFDKTWSLWTMKG